MTLILFTFLTFHFSSCVWRHLSPLAVYYSISKYYRKSSTELKRLESVSKSPIFALFSEALTGASTIRAYKQEERLVTRNDQQYNANTSTLMLLALSSEWLSIRLDMTSAIISFCVALYAILTIGTWDQTGK